MLARYGAEALELSLEDRFTAAGDERRRKQGETTARRSSRPDREPGAALGSGDQCLRDAPAPRPRRRPGRLPTRRAASPCTGPPGRTAARVVRLASGPRGELRNPGEGPRRHPRSASPITPAISSFATCCSITAGTSFDLAAYGRVEQLGEVLESDPALAKARLAGGHTPVHGVTATPEGKRVLDLLIACGADIDAAAADGATPALSGARLAARRSWRPF